MVWKNFFSDSGAVTPVIGEILMVGLTVVLASSIGAFVLSMDSPEVMPMSVLDVSDSSAMLNDSDDNPLLLMQHKGGDVLGASELKLIFTNSTISETLEWSDSDSRWSSGDLESNDFDDGTVGIGDVITISENGTNVVDTAGSYRMQIIHIPSNTMLIDSTVSLN